MRASNAEAANAKESDSSATQSQAPQVQETKPVNQTDLELQWQAFINTLPIEETALGQNMRIMVPKLTDGTADATVSVDNEDVAAMIQRIKPQLLEFLHKALHNSLITLSINIIEQTQAPPRVYNKREQLKYFCEQNPTLINLGKSFKLELS